MSMDISSVNSGGYSLAPDNSFIDDQRIQKLSKKAQKINASLSTSPNRMLFRAMRSESSTPEKKLDRLYGKYKKVNIEMVDLLTQSLRNQPLKILSCARILGLKENAKNPEILCQVSKHLVKQDSPQVPRLLKAISGKEEGPPIEFVSTPILTQQHKNAHVKITDNLFARIDEAVEQKDLISAHRLMDEMIATIQEEMETLRDEPLSEKRWERIWSHLHMQACLCKSFWDENGNGDLRYGAFLQVNDLLKALHSLQYKKNDKPEKLPSYSKRIYELKVAIENNDLKGVSKLFKHFHDQIRRDFALLSKRFQGNHSIGGEVYFNHLFQNLKSCLSLFTSDVRKGLEKDSDFLFYEDSLNSLMPLIQAQIEKQYISQREIELFSKLEKSLQLP